MTYQELIERIAKAQKEQIAPTQRIVDQLIKETFDALKSGEEVRLPGLGKLTLVDQKEQTRPNLLTGESMTIPAKKRIKFSAFPAAKAAVNQ